jgi:hypothetical protein
MLMVNLLKKLSQRSYFPLLVVFVACGLTCVLALRHNNTQMIELRDQVYAADKAGGDVNGALNRLRGYVYGHMNTDLSTGTSVKPPIQLPYTYQRLQDMAEHDANSTSLYTDAENYCQAQIPASESISGRGRIGCVTDYITSHGGKQAATVPTSLYEFDFASPKWSPDLAGWSLVASIISGLSLAVTFLAHRAGHRLPTI